MKELSGVSYQQNRPSTSTAYSFNNRQQHYQNIPENFHPQIKFYSPQLQNVPILMNASRPFSSPNNRCYSQQHTTYYNLPDLPPCYEESNKRDNFIGNFKKSRDSKNQLLNKVPNGPLVEFTNQTIPDGPLLGTYKN